MADNRALFEDRLHPELVAAGIVEPIDEEAEEEALRQQQAGTLKARLERTLQAAGYDDLPAEKVFFICALCSIVCTFLVVATGFVRIVPLALPIAMAGGALAPLSLFRKLGERKRMKIEHALPDAMDLMVSSLRAGTTIEMAFQYAAEGLSGPLSEELEEVVRRLQLGEAPSEVLEDFENRAPTEGVRLFAQALAIKWNVGGELSETIQRISDTIRERVRFQGEVRALISQGKLTGAIMMCLPYVLGLVMWFMQPNMISPLWEAKAGNILLNVVIVMQIIGYFWIKKLTKLEA